MQTEEIKGYAFDRFRLDVEGRLLLRDGVPLPLTPKALDTLAYLLAQPGVVVSKEELIARIWAESFVEEGVLTQNIYTLRKALGQRAEGGAYIETVPRRGYRFAAPVRVLAKASEGVPEAAPGNDSRQAPVRTLAVLPFVPFNQSQEDEILGLGMADALINRLSKIRRLTVRPTSAVRTFVGVERDGAEVGRRLGVDAVLDGSLQRAGEQIRISVQLVAVRHQTPIWAESFDAVATDIFALQDSISERVVERLRLRLSSHERSDLQRLPTTDTEAYDAYVRGRFFWNRRTEASLLKAVQYFEQAIALDPAYAEAYAGQADTHVLLPLYGSVPPRTAFPHATAAALEALALDDSLASAHTSLAYARFIYEWDFAAAEAAFVRAIELNPGYANAHHWYAFLLSAKGRHGEAIASARQAVRLDPLSLVINTDLGFVLYCARRYAEAAEHLGQTLELDPAFPYAHFVLALTQCAAGAPREAAASCRRAAEVDQSSTILALLGHALGLAGERQEAEEVIAILLERDEHQYVQASRLALIHTGLGDTAKALAALATACQERSRFVVFLETWPLYDPLRDQPAFAALLRRVGLG